MKAKKISLLMASVFAASTLYAVPTDADIKRLQAQVDELNERVDANEFQAALNRVKFGLDFSAAVGNTYLKGVDDNFKAKGLNKWSSELHLNMSSAINDYTHFYGRLSMAKNWGQMGMPYTARPVDIDAGRNLSQSGSSLYVSRAYVDFAVSPEFIATIGRQPGTDGPGSNLRNNALRQSTYPALLINTLGDALVLTYKPEALSDYAFAARAGFGKTYQFDQDGAVRDWISDSGDIADSDLYYASVESKLPLEGIGFGNNLFILSYTRLQNFALPIEKTFVTGSDSGPYIKQGVHNLGNSEFYNIHFESYNIADLGLNYFGSLGYYKGSGAKEIPVFMTTTTNGTTTENIVTRTKPFNEKTGYSLHVGIRYDFTPAFKLGLEGFYGSRFWYAMSRPSFNDPLNIRATRGYAADLYGIYAVDNNQFLRLSYTYIKNLWGNRSLPMNGAPGKNGGGWSQSTANNFMLMYNVKF